ncbi:DUF2975 domain-containing protein [Bacillus haikouensis]|uniref:DUF2975 domain-containing protein n=1 Tax=Bacillus haikouensis TaxID=1510468 RepID=UPI0015526D12|nr:DUF2975 domain-containing protein [Bacillus haikouensis]NQD64834.1 DUF2975 domain-containing protein [Bacillus haikouensis]
MKQITIVFLKSAIIILGLVVLCISIFGLPKIAAFPAEANPEYAYLKWPVMLGLYITEIPFYLALYQSFKLVGFINQRIVFSEEVVRNLKLIKLNAWSITLLYSAGAILLLTQNALHPGIAIAGIVIIFASVTISVFVSVLLEVLNHALELKSENNLTV